MFKLFGKIVRFNNDEITIKLSFLNSEILQEIEERLIQQTTGEFYWKFKYKKSKVHYQQKCWYGSLKLILKAQEIIVTSETLQDEDEEQRKAIFPLIEYWRSGKQKYRPKRMSDCSYQEMQRNIEVLHERHKHLKIDGDYIDFNNLKLK